MGMTANLLTMAVPITADPTLNRQLAARRDFGVAYAKSKGWDPTAVTMDQVLEIREQPGWQNPVAGEKTLDTEDHLYLDGAPPAVVAETIIVVDKKEDGTEERREVLRRGELRAKVPR